MNDFLKFQELYHHGIKGQKWGVRRFQDEDGKQIGNKPNQEKEHVHKQTNVPAISSITPIFNGIKGVSDSASKLFDGKDKGKKVYNKYPDMSDSELQTKLNRMRMEQQYSDLMGDTKSVKSGGEIAKEILQTIGAVAGIGVSSVLIIDGIRKLVIK